MRVDWRSTIALVAVTLVVSNAPLAAQRRDEVLRARAVRADLSVKVWSTDGSITFVGWDKDSIVMRGQVPRGRRVMFAGSDAAMKVGTEGDSAVDDAHGSSLVVFLPKRATVSAKTVTADIAAVDVSGWFYTVAGRIHLMGTARSATLESISGNLDVDVSAPWVKAQTGSGTLVLRGAVNDADLSTVSGPMGILSPSVMRGLFSSVSGAISYAAEPRANALFELSTHSGNVDLGVPAGVSGTFTLSSVSGTIRNDLAPLRPASTSSGSTRLDLGRGGPHVTVRSFRGDIRLHRL